MKVNMKEVMQKAVKLAKKMEGDWIARMKMALKAVWALIKKGAKKMVKVEVMYGWKNCYVARIKGTHPKWKLDREFLNADEKQRSYSGKTGKNIYFIKEDGIYEKGESGNKAYFIIENGVRKDVELEDVLNLVK